MVFFPVPMRYAAALFVLLLVLGCTRQEPNTDEERVVTTVEGTTITERDFEASYINFLIKTGQNDTPENRYYHLAALTDASLLADEAERRAYGGDSAFATIEDRARRRAVGGRYFEKAFLETLPPLEDDEVRQAFVRSKQEVVVRHLFYRNQAEAEAAYARIQAGRSFLEEAVVCYNLAAIDSSAGYLGPIRYFQVDDAFAEAAFSMDVGEISPPVRSRFGFHIIRVDDKFSSPIITESEYQTKRSGMMSQVALHTRRLEGDRFVRSFMENLDVQVNAPAVRSLAQAVQALENRVTPAPVEVELGLETVQLDLRALQQELTPDTPLATYTLGSDTLTFTAEDYYFWLPVLPFSEASNRTSASVGRALRNEALYRAGIQEGLDTDPQVLGEVSRARRHELTRRMRDSLRSAVPFEITEDDLRTAFMRSPASRRKQWIADFWTIPFGTQAEAETAQTRLSEDVSQASNYTGLARYENRDLRTVPEWAPSVRQAPVEQVAIARQASGSWAVVYVERREGIPTTFEAVRDSLAQALAPQYNEYRLLQRLYEQAAIATDTLLFEQMMKLDDTP